MMRQFLKLAVLLVIVTACQTSPVAHGDLQTGLQAYKRGDYETALKELRPVANQGIARAQAVLGLMYEKGKGVSRNFKEAANWYQRAAKQGYASAQGNLGWLYYKGRGVSQDCREAVRWSQRAVISGNANAQNNLGVMYGNGQCFAKDDKEATKWFRLAAEQGYARAQSNLGVMYSGGKGVSQDYKEAVKWYRRAAEQGDVRSRNNLGVRYMNGQGVSRDFISAHMWLSLAATKGHRKATKNLGDVEKKMTRAQIAEAKRRAAARKPTPSKQAEAVQTISASPTAQTPSSTFPTNELPMYGNIQKNDATKKADAKLIAYIKKLGYTKEKAAKRAVKRGWEFVEKDDLSKAMKRFNQAWLLTPENGDAYHGFAVVTAKRGGNSKEIESLFKLALSKPSVTVAAHVDYGRFLWTQKRYDESLERLHAALGINPKSYMANAHISFVHYKRREFKKACKWGKRAEKNQDKLEPGYLEYVCSQ